ncbi:MAG: ABC transporter permease, partial [Anaerolineae bacterium]
MGGLTRQYVLTRLLMYILTIWIGATAVFFIPRLAPGDPITAQVTRMMERQGRVENADEMIQGWKVRFGLDAPVSVQYVRYLGNLVRFDFGYSLARFPTTAWEMVRPALPWSLGLLTVATACSFSIGITIGALMGWRKTPRWLQRILPASLTFTSIPYFMFGILLIYLIAFGFHWLPATGGYDSSVQPGLNLPFAWSVIRHSILPLVSIVLTSMGGWALGMRGLMISV